MPTKGENKAKDRRRLRKAEKRSSATTEKMLGKVARRGYGDGRVHEDLPSPITKL